MSIVTNRSCQNTSLSATNLSDSLSHTGISETRITFGERLPKLFRVEHERMRQNGRHVLFGDPPSYYRSLAYPCGCSQRLKRWNQPWTASTFSGESGTST
jgi:hypothetical protein